MIILEFNSWVELYNLRHDWKNYVVDYITELQIQTFQGKQVTEIENCKQLKITQTHTKLLRLKEKKSNWDFINILIYSLRNRT